MSETILMWSIVIALSAFAIRTIEFMLAYFKAARKLDPAHSCEVHKEIGCSHVDGYLCFMPMCDILKCYRHEKLAKPEFNQEEFDAMVEKGTKAWADVPDNWLDNLRNDG